MTQRCALIDAAGNVVNIIIADAQSHLPPEGLTLQTSEAACIGDTWNGSAFVRSPAPALALAAQRAQITAPLARLDTYISRGLEDYWIAIGFDTTKLPQLQQDRLARKRALRKQLRGM